MIDIIKYDDSRHRRGVIEIWKSVFNYKTARNDPGLSIDKKLSFSDGLFFVAVDNEKVVGTIMAGYDGHRGWIYSLAVLPEFRHRNVGSRLLSYAESKLSELGCVKINLQVLRYNEKVIDFYIKNGFELEDRISMGKEVNENINKSRSV
jgi:ribosomal protein S18 acetylase RimI-like enzyme